MTPSDLPMNAAIDPMLTIRPLPRSIMRGITSRQQSSVVMRLRSTTDFTSSEDTAKLLLGSGFPPEAAMSPPALLTSTSIGPRSLSICSTAAFT